MDTAIARARAREALRTIIEAQIQLRCRPHVDLGVVEDAALEALRDACDTATLRSTVYSRPDREPFVIDAMAGVIDGVAVRCQRRDRPATDGEAALAAAPEACKADAGWSFAVLSFS